MTHPFNAQVLRPAAKGPLARALFPPHEHGAAAQEAGKPWLCCGAGGPADDAAHLLQSTTRRPPRAPTIMQIMFMSFAFGGTNAFYGRHIGYAHRKLILEQGLNLQHFDAVAGQRRGVSRPSWFEKSRASVAAASRPPLSSFAAQGSHHC